MTETDDPLWTHFKPLWLEFEKAGQGVLVAGGYGLFLKQQWLLSNSTQIVISLDSWRDAAPRATGDMDLIVALDLIGDEVANKQLSKALEEQGFTVSEELHGKRWKYFKEIGNEKRVLVELHAPMPDGDAADNNLAANRFAVKHKPSLGDEGVHGRTNHEAVGSELHPFQFEMGAIRIAVPNPVTWTVMKLTAAEDTWKRSLEENRETKDRRYYRDQAIKHAHDACRVVAMMAVEEGDAAAEIIESIKDTAPYQGAAVIYRDFFTGEDNWANEVLKDKWLPEDLEVIHSVLASWYNS